MTDHDLLRSQLSRRSLLLYGGVGALALTGCASGSKPGNVTGPGPGNYKLDLGAYKGPVPTDKPVELRYLRQIATPAAEDYYRRIYAEWTAAYPNITIKEETVAYGDLNQKLQTYVAAGDAPDIMMGKGDFVQAYVYNKIPLNLSDYMTPEFINDLTPAAKAQLVVDGKLYAWPWESSQIMLYFNRDLFKKAGVEAPPETADLDQGWTWAQFEKACMDLSAALNRGGSVETYALAASDYGNGGPGSNYFYEGIYLRSMGDPSAARDSSEYKTFIGVGADGSQASGYVDTKQAIEGMGLYQRLFQQKVTPSVALPRQFEDAKAAMKFGPFSFSRRYADKAQKDWYLGFDWGVTPVPRGTITFNHVSGDSPIISAGGKHPAEATAFMAFLHNDTNRVAWHKAWGSMPARLSLFDKLNYTLLVDKLGRTLIEKGHAAPVTPGYLEYFGEMNTAVKDIALGAKVDERLHGAGREIDGLIKRYKS